MVEIGESKPDEKKTYLENKMIEYRRYQEIIAQKCVGKNSLVVIPTGLGKTIIGILVAAKLLELVPSNSKIIILAPTRPLIEQHYQSFIQKLSIPKEKFAILTGKIAPTKRAEVFETNQVLFFTPQTLRNDLVNKKYDLSSTCLVIFDEAHHASGDYPYPLIADEYVQQNSDGTILALTASPGASKKKIIDLCNILHVPLQNIHIRSRKDDDVKIYLKPMDIYKIGVEMSNLMEEAYLSITQVLEDRLLYLAHLHFLTQEKKPLYKHVLRKELVKLNLELLEIIKGDGDKTGAYSGISVNAQALILHHMLELIEQQGLDMLMEYLEKMRKDSRKKSSSKAIKMLVNNPQLRRVYIELKKNEEFSPKELIHPKLPVLKKCLLEELKNNKEAKILVFVKLRNSVKNIVKKLEGIDLIRPVRFVGQATKSKEDKGLSQKQQVEILELFKKGKYNVLVATNVAEEGLDIAECDLVIFYDVVASEIRLIQRKGRTARHREGKVLILYTKNTRDDIYLKIALKKLKKMNVNLKNKQQLHEYYVKVQGMKQVLFNQESIYIHEKANNNIILPKNVNVKAEIPSPKIIIPKRKKFNLDYFAEKAIEAKENPLKEKNSGIIINKDLPLKYGLRHELKTRSIPFITVTSEVQVVIHDKIVVQVYEINPQHFLIKEFLSLYEKFRKDHELVIFVFDLVDFQESFGGEKRLFKRKIQELSIGNNLQIVPIDDHSELFFLVRSLYEQKNSR